MDTISTFREGLRWAYELLEMLMAEVTQELAHAHPPGIANPLAAIYAHVDLPVAKGYAKAAYESADAYLASLNERDLEREIDLTSVGFGIRTLGWCWNVLVISHLNNMIGEISVLKGIQNTKGYPF